MLGSIANVIAAQASHNGKFDQLFVSEMLRNSIRRQFGQKFDECGTNMSAMHITSWVSQHAGPNQLLLENMAAQIPI